MIPSLISMAISHSISQYTSMERTVKYTRCLKVILNDINFNNPLLRIIQCKLVYCRFKSADLTIDYISYIVASGLRQFEHILYNEPVVYCSVRCALCSVQCEVCSVPCVVCSV